MPRGLARAGARTAWSTIPTAPRRGCAIAASLADALEGVDFVQENGAGDRRGEAARSSPSSTGSPPPDAMLASSTSAIVAIALHRDAAGPRALPGRPSGQPAASGAAGRAVRRAVDRARRRSTARARRSISAIGQVPITVKREIDGFVLNRLQGALLAEAFRLVGEGYVSPQDLDHTRQGRARPALVVHGAVRDHRAQRAGRHSGLLPRYGPSLARLSDAEPDIYRTPNIELILTQWAAQAGPDAIAARMRWRDRRLAALKAHQRAQPAG